MQTPLSGSHLGPHTDVRSMEGLDHMLRLLERFAR